MMQWKNVLLMQVNTLVIRKKRFFLASNMCVRNWNMAVSKAAVPSAF